MLLTLDLATRVGWTLGPPDATGFDHGTERLPSTGEDIGAFATAFQVWLGRKLDCGVTDVVFESPVLPPHTQIMTLRKLYGLAYHVELLCTVLRVEQCREVHAQRVKKFIAGHGRADKDAMIHAVRRLGYRPEDDNAADAIAIRLYVLHQDYPQLRSRFGLDLGALA